MKACDLCRNKDRGECAVYKPCALAKRFKLMEKVLDYARCERGCGVYRKGKLVACDCGFEEDAAALRADAKGQDITQCPSCLCMTKTVGGKCGKCGEAK